MIQVKNFNLIVFDLTSTHYRVIKATIDNSVVKNFLYPAFTPFYFFGTPIDEFYLSNTVIQNSYMNLVFMYINFFKFAQLSNVTFENHVASSSPVISLNFVRSLVVDGITFTNYT
jgi:hypothetical protein